MIQNRYNRQIILPDFGNKAQEKLYQAKVLVVGAGGLGCPVLQYLAAAGVGNLGIVDFDRVDRSNLQRQTLFREGSEGEFKAEAAKERLQQQNSEIKITTFPKKLTNQNALSLLEKYDIIVDCTDNFQTRYLLNDACQLLHKPLVYGAIYQYGGQVSVFNVEKDGIIGTNYRDLFPSPPQFGEVPNCNEAGVLGTLSGLIGTLQANEVIKLITGIGEVLSGKLLLTNILDYTTHIFKYEKSEQTHSPKTEAEFLSINYEEICGAALSDEIEDVEQLEAVLEQKDSVLIDVRNEEELPKISTFAHKIIPLSVLEEQIEELEEFNSIVFVCRLGIRSARAAQMVKQKYPHKKIQHIRNGIMTIIKDEN